MSKDKEGRRQPRNDANRQASNRRNMQRRAQEEAERMLGYQDAIMERIAENVGDALVMQRVNALVGARERTQAPLPGVPAKAENVPPQPPANPEVIVAQPAEPPIIVRQSSVPKTFVSDYEFAVGQIPAKYTWFYTISRALLIILWAIIAMIYIEERIIFILVDIVCGLIAVATFKYIHPPSMLIALLVEVSIIFLPLIYFLVESYWKGQKTRSRYIIKVPLDVDYDKTDLRSDIISLQSIKHNNPLISEAEVHDEIYMMFIGLVFVLKKKEHKMQGGVSSELFAHLCVSRNIGPGLDEGAVWLRLQQCANNFNTINFDRYQSLSGSRIVQNTILFCFGRYLSDREAYNKLSFRGPL